MDTYNTVYFYGPQINIIKGLDCYCFKGVVSTHIIVYQSMYMISSILFLSPIIRIKQFDENLKAKGLINAVKITLLMTAL